MAYASYIYPERAYDAGSTLNFGRDVFQTLIRRLIFDIYNMLVYQRWSTLTNRQFLTLQSSLF